MRVIHFDLNKSYKTVSVIKSLIVKVLETSKGYFNFCNTYPLRLLLLIGNNIYKHFNIITVQYITDNTIFLNVSIFWY